MYLNVYTLFGPLLGAGAEPVSPYCSLILLKKNIKDKKNMEFLLV
jgi:hypothetical protein